MDDITWDTYNNDWSLFCTWSWCSNFIINWTWTIDLWITLTWSLDPSRVSNSCIKKVCSFTDFSCSVDNIKLWFDFSCNIDFSKSASWTLINTLSGQVNSLTTLSNFTNYYNITLPNTPNLDLTIPYLYIDNSWWIAYSTATWNLSFATWSLLNKNHMTKNTDWKNFISFLLWIIYIVIRLVIIYWIIYIFKLFYETIKKLVENIFWLDLSWKWNGNFWSVFFYVAFLISVFSIFTWFYWLLPWLLPIINIINTIVTVIISSIAFNFFSYSVFQTTVNLFFVWVLSSFILYLLYLLANKFFRLN